MRSGNKPTKHPTIEGVSVVGDTEPWPFTRKGDQEVIVTWRTLMLANSAIVVSASNRNNEIVISGAIGIDLIWVVLLMIEDQRAWLAALIAEQESGA